MSLVGGRYTVHQPSRRSRLGSWHVLSTTDGRRFLGLRLDSADPAALERLDRATAAAATTQLPGLVPLVDRVADSGATWLITNVTGGTLQEALATGAELTGANAALIATDTAQTLLKLHQAGLAHGDVNTSTVVLSPLGAALLAEAGYAHALAGTASGPGFDLSAWAQLLRQVAERCSDPQVGSLLQQAAGQAEATGGSAGFTAALQLLGPALGQISGFGDRAAFSAFAGTVPVAVVSTAQAAPGDEPTVRTPPPTAPVQPIAPAQPVRTPAAQPPQFVPGAAAVPDDATRLGQRAADEQRRSASGPVAAPHVPAQQSAPGSDVLRFGQGVPPAPPAWQLAAASAGSARPRKRSVWKRISAVLSGLVTLGLLVVVGLVLWQRFGADPIVVSSVTVQTAEPLKGKCDVNVDIVGTIETNGQAGTISYEWLLSDGRREGPLSQSVGKGESTTQVHLFWEFTGRGTLEATATLRVLSPAPLEGSTEFTYACR